MILPIQRCEGNWTRNILYYASDVLVDIRNTTVMLRCGNDMVSSKDWVRRSQDILRNNSKISQNVRNNQAQPGLCWQKVKMSSMISQSSRGRDGISSHEFNLHLWTSQSVDGDHDKFCREILGRCHRGAMPSSNKNDEVKGYWNHGYDTSLKSSLLFKVKW